jgi:hypothetical protein
MEKSGEFMILSEKQKFVEPKVSNMNLITTPTPNNLEHMTGHKPSKIKKIN